MAKRREGPRPQAPGARRDVPLEQAPGQDPELLAALSLGNQAASDLAAATPALTEVRALADRAITALRVAPRDAERSARLVDLVRRSALPEDRRALIALRLTEDQRVADQVAEIVARHLGADGEALRSDLVAALDAAATRVAAAPRDAAAALADGSGVAPALVHDLAGILAFLWDEDEEELAAPGDYAAEESGF
ncbi:MAG: hypothetical protein R3F59_22575 [Myxococcota bacterium]